MASDETTEWTNVIANTFNHINPMSKEFGGSVTFVTVETLVSKALRVLIAPKSDPGVVKIALYHTASIPFLGGAGAFISDPKTVQDEWGDNMLFAASQIPGYWLGEYIINSVYEGRIFRLPKLTFWEVFVSALAKFLARPTYMAVAKPKFLPKAIEDRYALFEAFIARQNAGSNLKKKE